MFSKSHKWILDCVVLLIFIEIAIVMSTEHQISDGFILPLFDEIFVVKERDFSIQYHPLGEGRQKLLMLVSSTSEEFLPNTDLQLLQTIIEKGLRKQLQDVWVVNIERFPNATMQNLWDYFQPQQVIIWGCKKWATEQGIQMEVHRQAYVNAAELLMANELNSYQTDQVSKSKLWMALQRMFFN